MCDFGNGGGVVRMLVCDDVYAMKFPQERSISGMRVRVWDEDCQYLGVGVGVETRKTGVAIFIDSRIIDSNNVLNWIYA